EYYGHTFTKAGSYNATIVVTSGGQTKRYSTTLTVTAPDPVAVVTGLTKVTEGRPFPYLHHLNNSYTPLESKGETLDKSKEEKRFKKVGDASYTNGFPPLSGLPLGDYVLEGKVYDSLGNAS